MKAISAANIDKDAKASPLISVATPAEPLR